MKRNATSATPRLRVVAGGGTLPHDDDEALVRQVRERAPGAAARLWDRHAGLVYGAVARALGPDADVDDLVQEVFMRLFDRLPTLRDASALRSFTYSIVVRVLRHERRRRFVRRIMRPFDADVEEPSRPAPCAESREALRRFYAILDDLGARERDAYVLRHLEGLSLDETAVALGVSLATVKRVLARAGATVDARLREDPLLSLYREMGESR